MIIDHVTIRTLLNVTRFITKPIFYEDDLIYSNISYCLFKGHILIIGYSIETNYGIYEYPYIDNYFIKKKKYITPTDI
jgi:hypothetical protein